MLDDLRWDQVVSVRIGQKMPVDFLRSVFLKRAIEYKVPVYRRVSEGFGSFKDISPIIEEAGGILIVEEKEKQSSDITVCLYLFDELFLCVSEQYGTISILMEGSDFKQITELLNAFGTVLKAKPPKGRIMMLANDNGNYYLVELGEMDCALERGNYSEKILEQYDKVVADLKSEIPSGRLTVLDGLPGCGKSFLIRGLISEVEATYVYVPANLSGALTGPEVIPVFLSERNRDLPIVLIMEDADASIATRQIDNVGNLSDILNMSDGILGDMADIRIIATTNAKKAEIDAAVCRTGRINEHISFSHLKTDHAVSIFSRLTGIDDDANEGIISLRNDSSKNNNLATVYNLARQHGWKPVPRKKRSIRGTGMWPNFEDFYN